MKRPTFLLHLFIVLLLSCHTEYVAAKSTCMHSTVSKKIGNLPVAILNELPRKGHTSGRTYTAIAAEESKWEPIRIAVSSKDLDDSKKYCTADLVENYEKLPNFYGFGSTCTKDYLFTQEKKELLLQQLIPSVIKLHSDRLLANPMPGNVIVPDLSNTPCKYFTIPEEHHSVGIPNADKVLYVAAPPSTTWAVTCATLNNDKGRPIASGMAFAPWLIVMTQEAVRHSAHELAHALGFSYKVLNAHSLIKNRTGVRGKPNPVGFVIGNETKKSAQRHFNCSTAEGMELEDEDHDFGTDAHWERRNAKDELMAGTFGIGLYTALTMSLFEDLGYYKAQWGMEEPMSWGKDVGCPLLEKKCIDKGRTVSDEMFCTERTENVFSCTSDRLAVGECDLTATEESLPSQFQYFVNNTLAAYKYALTDYCPIIGQKEKYCTDTKNKELLEKVGSRVGPNSRCVKSRSLRIDGKTIGDVCVEVRCKPNKELDVRYLGDEAYYPCQYGSTVAPYGVFSGGKIECPRYEDVCTVSDSGLSLVTRTPHVEDQSPAIPTRGEEADTPITSEDINSRSPSEIPTTREPRSKPSENQGSLPMDNITGESLTGEDILRCAKKSGIDLGMADSSAGPARFVLYAILLFTIGAGVFQ